MKKIFLLFITFFITSHLIVAQSDNSRTNTKKLLRAAIKRHQSAMDSLSKKLDEVKESEIQYPYWDIGGGALGSFNLNSFSNWANRGEDINSSAINITLGANGRADFIGEKGFWKNRGRLLVGWQRLQRFQDEEAPFLKTADILQFGSTYGRNITKELAMSVLAEWESNLVDQTINPSYLDLSLGFTWTPNRHFNSIIHPINYELALAESDQFESSLGAKLIFQYDKEIHSRLNLTSSFSGFMSYEDISFLSNLTWTNGLNVKVFRSLGIALEHALRRSPQELAAIDDIDPGSIQSYFVMGLSFEIP